MQFVYKRVADMIADKLNKSYSTIIRLLRCRLCFSLLRSAITCLRGHSRHYFTNLLTTDPALVVAEGWVTRRLICISWSYTNLNYYLFFSFSLPCYCTIIIIIPDLKKNQLKHNTNESTKVLMPRCSHKTKSYNKYLCTNTTMHHSTKTATAVDACIHDF